MSELANKTFIVTGANTGIGRITARELARQGASVILACRSQEKTQPVLDEIRRETQSDRAEYVPLDLGDLASVRTCAEALLARKLPIHGLINNAGLAGQRSLTKDGFEIQFGTNHLGHYLLTRLLLDRIVESATGPHRQRVQRLALQRQVDRLGRAAADHALDHRHEGVRGLEARQRAVHQGARAPARGQARHRVRAAPGRRRDRRVAPRPGAAPLGDQAVHDHARGRRAGDAAVRDRARARRGERPVHYGVGGKERKPSKLSEDAALAAELWKRSAAWTGLPD